MEQIVRYEAMPFASFERGRCVTAGLLTALCCIAWMYSYTGVIVYEISKITTRPMGEQVLSFSKICFSLLPYCLLLLGSLWLFRLLPRQREELYEKYLRELQEINRYENGRFAATHITEQARQGEPITEPIKKDYVDPDKVEIVSGVTVADIRALFDQNNLRYRPSLAAAVWLWCSFESKGVPAGMTPKQEAERRLGAEIPSEISTNWTDKEEDEILKMVNWQKKPTKTR